MSPNSLRVLAGAAAAVLALLTAITVGFVSKRLECTPAATTPATTAPAPPPPPPQSPTSGPGAAVGSRGAAAGNLQEQRNSTPPTSAPASSAPAGGQNTAATPGETCDTKPFGPGPAVVALVGTGLTAAVVLGLLLLAGARRAPAPAAPARPGSAGGGHSPPAGGGGVPGGGGVAGGGEPRLDADRAALVRACIYVRDRVTSRALADRLAAALQDAGISVVEPVGERFDPARHEAGGATPAGDPALTGTIAAVEVPGYTDRTGRVLRAPVVTVYQAAGSAKTQPIRRRTEENR